MYRSLAEDVLYCFPKFSVFLFWALLLSLTLFKCTLRICLPDNSVFPQKSELEFVKKAFLYVECQLYIIGNVLSFTYKSV